MKIPHSLCIALGLLSLGALSSQGAIVFSEVDLSSDTITLTNTDTSAAVDLSGWRFCSHDLDSAFVYSDANGFNGVSINPGESLVIDTTSINFAGPLGENVISIGLYINSSFGSSAALASFIQFAPEGATDTGSSETRTGVAIGAGLWDAAGSFVEVGPDQDTIILNDFDNAVGASSYSAVPEPSAALLGVLAGFLGLARRRR